MELITLSESEHGFPNLIIELNALADHSTDSLVFDDEADEAPPRTIGVGNGSRAANSILALLFLREPSRLWRRPSACNAANEETPSVQRHSHGVLPYWKAADEDVGSVIHGSLH
jgi:hypothetical protein